MRILPLSALLLLAACAAPQTVPRTAITAPPAISSGMERLLGQPAEAAISLLGPAQLDRREGPARQLQYAGACILDLWYYPQEGRAPTATHAEARLPNGQDVAPAECFRSLLKTRRG